MASFPKLKGSGNGGSEHNGDAPKRDEPVRKPRVVLTENAIFPAPYVKKSATEPSDADMAHHVCSVGDIVMLTDEEFDRHQAAGVCVVDTDERVAA